MTKRPHDLEVIHASTLTPADPLATIERLYSALEQRATSAIANISAEQVRRHQQHERERQREEARARFAEQHALAPLPVWGKYRPDSGVCPAWQFLVEVDRAPAAKTRKRGRPRKQAAPSTTPTEPRQRALPPPTVKFVPFTPTPKPRPISIIEGVKLFDRPGSTGTAKRGQKQLS